MRECFCTFRANKRTQSYSSLTLLQANFIGCLCLDRWLRATIARRIVEVNTPVERAKDHASVSMRDRMPLSFARGRVLNQCKVT